MIHHHDSISAFVAECSDLAAREPKTHNAEGYFDRHNLSDWRAVVEEASSFRNYFTVARLNEQLGNYILTDELRDGLERATAELHRLSGATKQAPMFQATHESAGIIFDNAAYEAGEDEYMISIEPTTTPEPACWIAANIGALSGVTAEQFLHRGLALAAAVQRMEAEGRPVGLMAYSHAVHYGTETTQTILVKRPEESLNINDVLNIFARCETFRCGIFLKRLNMEKRLDFATEQLPPKYLPDYAKDAIIVPHNNNLMHKYDRLDTAIKFINEQLDNAKK